MFLMVKLHLFLASLLIDGLTTDWSSDSPMARVRQIPCSECSESAISGSKHNSVGDIVTSEFLVMKCILVIIRLWLSQDMLVILMLISITFTHKQKHKTTITLLVIVKCID